MTAFEMKGNHGRHASSSRSRVAPFGGRANQQSQELGDSCKTRSKVMGKGGLEQFLPTKRARGGRILLELLGCLNAHRAPGVGCDLVAGGFVASLPPGHRTAADEVRGKPIAHRMGDGDEAIRKLSVPGPPVSIFMS